MPGVGTEIEKLVPTWVTRKRGKCNCATIKAKLDDYGIGWCENNIDLIAGHLVNQSEHLIPAFRVVPASGRQAIAKRIVQKAIKNAKA